jgi:CDP-diacylglycerol--serine O-phosphatidyltransferase
MTSYRFIFPNIFTVANIFCGFLSIISAAEGEPTTAAWLIILGGFLDALDGKIARISGAMSDLGKELDSIADFLTFGVAPAFLVYNFKLHMFGKWGWIIGLIYITASGYRLARFNLLAQSEEKKNFLGLTVPVAALTLSSYIILCYYQWEQVRFGEYLITMMILFSALMVSQIEYDALPDNFNSRESRIKIIYILGLAAAAVIHPRLLMFPIFATYILIGLVKEGIRIVKLATGKGSNNNI